MLNRLIGCLALLGGVCLLTTTGRATPAPPSCTKLCTMVKTEINCILLWPAYYELADCIPCQFNGLTCQDDSPVVGGDCLKSDMENSAVVYDNGFDVCPDACKNYVLVQGFPTTSKVVATADWTRKTCVAKAP